MMFYPKFEEVLGSSAAGRRSVVVVEKEAEGWSSKPQQWPLKVAEGDRKCGTELWIPIKVQ